MKYILLIYSDEQKWSSVTPEELQRVYAGHNAYGEALAAAGVMVGGYELKPISTATTLRFDGGQVKTLDGPFAETKEQLGGYYVIDVENLEQAMEWAAKMPGMDVSGGAVEVRPLGMGG